VHDDQVDRLRNQLKALHRRMRREQPAVPGLSATSLEVLIAVDGADEPIRPGELGTDLQMTSPNVAAALRLLEGQGLVTRRPDQDDGRKAFIEMTAQGRTVVAEARRSWRAWLQDTIENTLTDSERTVLFLAGDLLQRLADDDPATRVVAFPDRRRVRARASR
jgi:DNA-binding MarR family transcriptional regulator